MENSSEGKSLIEEKAKQATENNLYRELIVGVFNSDPNILNLPASDKRFSGFRRELCEK